jgi:hypothetical protein
MQCCCILKTLVQSSYLQVQLGNIRAVKLDDSVASKNGMFTCVVAGTVRMAVPPKASLLSELDHPFFCLLVFTHIAQIMRLYVILNP